MKIVLLLIESRSTLNYNHVVAHSKFVELFFEISLL